MSPVLLFTGLFERAVALDKSWEKGYFSYAVYLDQLMRDARQRQTALTASSRTSAKPMDRLGGRSRHASLIPPNTVSYNTNCNQKVSGFGSSMQKHLGLLHDKLHPEWPQTGVAARKVGLGLGVATARTALLAESKHTFLLCICIVACIPSAHRSVHSYLVMTRTKLPFSLQ